MNDKTIKESEATAVFLDWTKGDTIATAVANASYLTLHEELRFISAHFARFWSKKSNNPGCNSTPSPKKEIGH